MVDFTPIKAETIAAIKDVVGEGGWKTASDNPKYFDDPRGRFTGQASLVALPKTCHEVAAITSICNRDNTAIIPYGGGTGVVAGQLSIASAEAITVSLERMNAIRHTNRADAVMVVEAGCILEDIHQAAMQYDMIFPLSMGSKGSCSIGGNLATNAGGIQVLRYGNARDLCLGIEAVLPNGELIEQLSPLRKNNTGYDLRHLIIGSEGTLGIITAAALVLKPRPREVVTVFCALPKFEAAISLLNMLRETVGDNLSAMELMCDFGLSLIEQHLPPRKRPLETKSEWYLLVEIAGQSGIREQAENSLAAALENGVLLDAVIAESESQREAIWALREMTPEANKLGGAFCNSDTSVPISSIENFLQQTQIAVAKINKDLRINSYGHIGDGNIHCNVLPPPGIAKADFIAANPHAIEAVRMAINDVTHHCGGAISAEHGIGRLKPDDLAHYENPARLSAMQAIKQALDPNNIMNPGVFFDSSQQA